MKRIAYHHSPHICYDNGEKYYKCTDCLNYVIRSDYKFCPYCGNKTIFQPCREYEQELFERIIRRIKFRLSNIFTLVKNEDSTYNLLSKDNTTDSKQLAIVSKQIITTLLIEFANKKVYRGSVFHPMFHNLFTLLSNHSDAKKYANSIFKEFIKESKRMV